MYNPFSLQNKTILVTGASSGIGRGIAIECSKMGANVILVARNEERLKETHSLLANGNHQIFVADLSSEVEIENMVSNISQIDGFIYSAGILELYPVKHINGEIINNIFSINTNAPLLLTSKLSKKKKLNKSSSIVYISSIAGNNIANVGEAVYAASKSALNGFTKTAAIELAKRGIRVNCINPYQVPTNLLSKFSDTFSDVNMKETLTKIPLNRVGTPEDIAHAVIFLLSDASSWVTGTSITIDGGFTLL